MGEIGAGAGAEVDPTRETEEEMVNRLTNRMLDVPFRKPLYLQCIAGEYLLAGDVVMWTGRTPGNPCNPWIDERGIVVKWSGIREDNGWGVVTRTVDRGEQVKVATRMVGVGERIKDA